MIKLIPYHIILCSTYLNCSIKEVTQPPFLPPPPHTHTQRAFALTTNVQCAYSESACERSENGQFVIASHATSNQPFYVRHFQHNLPKITQRHTTSQQRQILTPLHVLFLICLYISSSALSNYLSTGISSRAIDGKPIHICENFAPW